MNRCRWIFMTSNNVKWSELKFLHRPGRLWGSHAEDEYFQAFLLQTVIHAWANTFLSVHILALHFIIVFLSMNNLRDCVIFHVLLCIWVFMFINRSLFKEVVTPVAPERQNLKTKERLDFLHCLHVIAGYVQRNMRNVLFGKDQMLFLLLSAAPSRAPYSGSCGFIAPYHPPLSHHSAASLLFFQKSFV